jgi:hypothetical protein
LLPSQNQTEINHEEHEGHEGFLFFMFFMSIFLPKNQELNGKGNCIENGAE